MEPTASNLAAAVTQAAARELDSALAKIEHCLGQLNDEQLWWRPAGAMNSIGNLLLHLSGNLRQWIIAGLGGAEDVRNRSAEFAEQGLIEREQLLQQLRSTVAQTKDALANLTAADLLRSRRIQGFDVNGLEAIFDSIPHFRGHTQEIVHLTRVQLGNAYQFDFVPSSPEQGAPAT